MKLQITPTPSGTGYRAECLDLPGTPPVGEGSTETESVASLFYRMLADIINWWRYIKLADRIEINGVPWRREGERGDVARMAKDVEAVGAVLHWLETSEEVEIRASSERTDNIAAAVKIASAAWPRLRAALVAATPPAPPPAVGVEGEDERPKIDWHFCANGRKWRSYSSVFCSMCCGHYGSHRLTDADIPDPNVPPVVGVPVQVVERLLKRAIEDDGGWHIHDADLAWFKEHYESAKQGKVYVDTWPSRGVPVEVCERIAPALREAHKKHPQGLVILGAAKFCQAGGVNVDLTPAGTWEFLSGIEAARRGEGAGDLQATINVQANALRHADVALRSFSTELTLLDVPRDVKESIGERLEEAASSVSAAIDPRSRRALLKPEYEIVELQRQLAAAHAEVERLTQQVATERSVFLELDRTLALERKAREEAEGERDDALERAENLRAANAGYGTPEWDRLTDEIDANIARLDEIELRYFEPKETPGFAGLRP